MHSNSATLIGPNAPAPATPAATARTVDSRHSKYQEIKAKVHQDLLNRLNLERLTRVRREDAEPEIRGLIMGLLEKESQATPLSLFERDALISDVVNELFGLGPLEEIGRAHV